MTNRAALAAAAAVIAFAMPLKRDPSSAVFECACYEGNRGLGNILRAARAAEAAE